MKSILYTVLGMVAFASVACKSNPYEGKPAVAPPQKPQASPTPTPVPTATPTPAPTVPPTPKPIFSLDAPDIMTFTAGKTDEYIIRGTVPAPGTPQITFKDLPPGPVYNTADGKFSWKPGALDVKTFTIQIRLKSSADPVSVHTKDVVVIVSKAAVNPTSIVTKLVDPSGDALVFELRASDMALGQFPEWEVIGDGAIYSISKVTNLLNQSVLLIIWRPESAAAVLKLQACSALSCARREIQMADKVTLKDPDTGAVLNLGGER
jgi:hypothetical protein